MRSLFAPLKLDADSRKLHFVTELDGVIDDVCFFSKSHPDHDVNISMTGGWAGPLFCIELQ